MREGSGVGAATGTPPRSEAGPPHAEVRTRLSEWLEDTLHPRERAAIGAHLEGCVACQAFARALEATVRLARQLPRARLPARTRERLLAPGRGLPEAAGRSGGKHA